MNWQKLYKKERTMEHFNSLKKEDKQLELEAMERSIDQTASIQKLFKGKDAESALKAIDGLTGYKENNFHSDPYKHAYNAGQRSISVILRHLIERDVKEARKHLKETKNE
jgi:hypothetical protein